MYIKKFNESTDNDKLNDLLSKFKKIKEELKLLTKEYEDIFFWLFFNWTKYQCQT